MGKLDGLSVGSGKLRSGLDDLMASELGKHDYDWYSSSSNFCLIKRRFFFFWVNFSKY